ncbi:MAG: hypothetical protein ABJN42_04890 [Roseibium sp.]|uniref:hypothetical protein n=1 Tax=Roseibium sp. TaxID=1936156 RepID=UPI003297D8F6
MVQTTPEKTKLYPHQQKAIDAIEKMDPDTPLQMGAHMGGKPLRYPRTPGEDNIESPVYVIYLNQDFNETAHLVHSEREAVLTIAREMDVGADPLKGIGEDFWTRVDAAYEADGWKGASIFRIDAVDGANMPPIGKPVFTADELNRAELTGPLPGNPADPVWIVLGNQDYCETAVVFETEKQAIIEIVDSLGITEDHIEDASEFATVVANRYESGDWKGLSVLKANLQDLTFEKLGPEDLNFEMSDLMDYDDSPSP